MPSAAATAAFLLLALPRGAVAFLAGIDIGGEFSKFAIVLPKRQPEVVTNLHSKRKTPTAFSFVGQTRSFGDAALQLVGSSAPMVARFFPELLGRAANGSSVAGLPADFFPFELSTDPARHTYRLNVGDGDMSVEEVLAHFLHFGSHVSTLAAEKKKIKGAVLTVPALASQRQRQAMLDAAEIAGLPNPRLIHEISAAAIHRALDIEAPRPERAEPAEEEEEDLEPKEGDSPQEKMRKITARRARKEAEKKQQKKAAFKTTRLPVLIINMGSTHLEVCVVKYKFVKPSMPDSVSVKGCAASRQVAGRSFDLAIAERMLEKAAAKHADGELRRNGKALHKILAQATKIKHTLSANKDALFSVEALHDEQDFAETISRTDLEEWCSELFLAVTKPIDTALKRANLNLTSIHAVELIGGGWRVPRVQQVLSDYIAEARGPNASLLPLGQHMNGEEAPAMGAAYFAATEGEGFGGPRLRPVPLEDTCSHEYSISFTKANASQPGEDFNAKPQVVFKRGAALGGQAQNLQLKLIKSDLKLTLFENGKAIEEHHWLGLYKMHTVKYPDSPAPNLTFSVQLDPNGMVLIGKAQATFQATEQVADKKNKKTSVKKVSKKVTLDTVVHYKGAVPMSRKQRSEARKRFKELGERSRTANKGVASKNALEAYLFACRDKLAARELREELSAERLAELEAKLEEAQAWLHEQGDGVSAQTFVAKLSALKRELEPVLNQEERAREAPVEREGTAGTESAKEKAQRIARRKEERAKRDKREL